MGQGVGWILMLSAVGLLTPRGRALPYSPNQIEVNGLNGGLDLGGAVWGDYDNDGDLDILVSGRDSAAALQIRIHRNDGGGAFTLVNVAAAGAGLSDSSVAFGDMDGDADLDVLAGGVDSGGTRRIRVYRNDGAAFTLLSDVDALAAGTNRGAVAWGDFDNDGDLDILFCGQDGGGRRLRVYRNNGNGSFDATQIELAGGIDRGDVAWGDYDNDGDLDILFCGRTANNVNTGVLKIYPNNGDGTFGASFNVLNATTGYSLGDPRWGDYNNDGWLDVLVTGQDQGGNRQFRAYRNNGNGTFTQVEIPGAGLGYNNSAVAWGDVNNDGTLDALQVGVGATGREIRISTYNAVSGAFTATLYNPESANALGVHDGGASLGDYDADGDLDILVSGSLAAGTRQLRVYRSSASLTVTNTAPTAPSTLAGRFNFSEAGVSVASFTWNAGVDSGVGATPTNGLYYDIQVATVSDFARMTVAGLSSASPLLGGSLRPPSIFGGSTPLGMRLKSTAPWTPMTAHPGLRTDTTYYFRVRTIDAGLRRSAVSATETLWTGVAPATSTLAAAYGTTANTVQLSWNAAGDDRTKGNLTGNYRIQYSSNPAVVWSTSTTPLDAYTTVVATANVVPGAAQAMVITLSSLDYYYFVIWTQDDVGQFSLISNTAGSYPYASRSATISGGPYLFGALSVGVSSNTAGVITVTNDGTLTNTYSFSAATTTAGSPWALLSAPPAIADGAVIYGGFHGVRPALGDFGGEDVMTGLSQSSTGTRFSIDGTQTGVAVPVGDSRNAWFRLDMPTASSTESPQDITVTLTAGP
jgi:hypothetical protein